MRGYIVSSVEIDSRFDNFNQRQLYTCRGRQQRASTSNHHPTALPPAQSNIMQVDGFTRLDEFHRGGKNPRHVIRVRRVPVVDQALPLDTVRRVCDPPY